MVCSGIYIAMKGGMDDDIWYGGVWMMMYGMVDVWYGGVWMMMYGMVGSG